MEFEQEELKNSILALLKLQQIDASLFKLNEEFERPSAEYVQTLEAAEKSEQAYKQVERSWKQSERERRALELRNITLDEDVKKAETKRKEVRNTKEEFAANKEVENSQKKLQELKKLLEEKQQVVDEKTQTLEKLKAAWDEAQKAFEVEKSKREERLGGLEKEKADLEEKRKEYISQVSEDIFSMYERVQRLRRGSGIAVVKDGVCTGCFVTVPPKENQKLQKMNELLTCSSCSRILFPASELDGDYSELKPAQASNA